MNRQLLMIAAVACLVTLASRGSIDASGLTWSTIDHPLATQGTIAYGVDGGNIVGTFTTGGISHGYLFDGTTFTTFDHPLAGTLPQRGTQPQAISGSMIVGYYNTDSPWRTHGFTYDGTTFTTLDAPAVGYPWANAGSATLGISGTEVVGLYNDAFGNTHGYHFDGTTWTVLDAPWASTAFGDGTAAQGIDGNNIVGLYNDNVTQLQRGFLFDGTTYSQIDHPLGVNGTNLYDISGSLIVGSYHDGSYVHGLLYDGMSYSTLDHPLATNGTVVTGISGTTAVGYYMDAQGTHGFVVTNVPEPSTVVLTAFGTAGLWIARRRQRRGT